MATVNVCEIFDSIQGESTYAGLPCHFIRLTGCNLRCRYCDTRHAYESGRAMTVSALVKNARASRAAVVEITGGEPLLQAGFAGLAKALRDKVAKQVLVETNGTCDISVIPDRVIAVMDVKCPGSGENGTIDVKNISRLRSYDEVKFVIADRRDYFWASRFVEKYNLASRCNAVLFSPVAGKIKAKQIGEWILKDGLNVRLQVQLHKVMGLK